MMRPMTGNKANMETHSNTHTHTQTVASPLPLLLQQVGEVVALVHEVGVLAFLVVQLHDGAAVTFLGQQQLLQHPSVRLLLFVLQTVQLTGNASTLIIGNTLTLLTPHLPGH